MLSPEMGREWRIGDVAAAFYPASGCSCGNKSNNSYRSYIHEETSLVM